MTFTWRALRRQLFAASARLRGGARPVINAVRGMVRAALTALAWSSAYFRRERFLTW